MDKREMRREMKRLNMALTSEQRAVASARLFEQIEQMAEFAAAQTVAIFVSLPDELDTAEALARWSCTRRIVVPRVEGEVMQFYDYDPSQLESSSYGIAEPQGGVPADPSQIDLMVVPGMAFTADGMRMGRGKGYYDKYLSRSGFRAYKVGVCYRHQLHDTLPCEAHDVRMDRVLFG